MLKELLAYVLPLIAWGAVSGVLNLLLTRKSQIEAWVTANPRLAAWSKFLRGVGLDPWAVIAWFTLLVKKKLPEAQQADSPVAKLEQRKADAKRLGDEPPADPPPPPSRWVPPTMLLCLALMLLAACNRDARPCSAEDLATGPLALHNAKCAARRQAAFPNLPDETCDATPGCKAIVDECDRWAEERCQ
jgi:hypothetical protein